MTPEERTLLSDLFRHLREVEGQPRDAEAESFIRQSVQSQPLSAYYMAQTVLVQQQALTAAQSRIEELERQLREAQSRAAQPAAPTPSGGSFLSNALGIGRSPWGGRSEEPRPAPQPQVQPQPSRSPWGGAPQPGYAPPMGAYGGGQPGYPQQPGFAPQRAGGGFLANAATTAAGVAGGMLAASAISSMLSHSPGPFGDAAASAASHVPGGETVINNFYGDSAAPEARNVDYQQDADYQTDDASFDDGGDNGGGDDSWV
ncbi:hypothetical protein J2847_004339 [Azospirillum agricola]|uniref:DUF2076 domain-containing protein n=1 Tax=Azospirillum agricola TaxID=1720247 RepID=UPI001AE8D401|nr:DUF2076 domain-containing protein [Azospirillum agricola]MBP2231028.1 hypothetical protein [Azospirillum agricola]